MDLGLALALQELVMAFVVAGRVVKALVDVLLIVPGKHAVVMAAEAAAVHVQLIKIARAVHALILVLRIVRANVGG